MNVGDVLPMKSVRVDLDSGWVSYKAPKGEHFLVVLLGLEPVDGSRPLDPRAVFNALGWTEQEDANVLRDLSQAILQSTTMADFMAVRKTVEAIEALQQKGGQSNG